MTFTEKQRELLNAVGVLWNANIIDFNKFKELRDKIKAMK